MKFITHLHICIIFLLAFPKGTSAQNLRIFNTFEEFKNSILLHNDTTYVINFWATWCKPCVKELPYFESYHRTTGKQKIKVILVSLDFNKQIDTHLKPFLSKNHYTAHTVMLADKNFNSWISEIDESWSGAIPATLLLSGDERSFVEKEFESSEDISQYVDSFTHH